MAKKRKTKKQDKIVAVEKKATEKAATKEKPAAKKVEKVEELKIKVPKKPLLQLLDKSEAPDYVLMGVLDFAGLLEQFKTDLVNNTSTINMTDYEFNKLIENYYNRKI